VRANELASTNLSELCPQDEFFCTVNVCIPKNLKCNGITECSNGKDESDACQMSFFAMILALMRFCVKCLCAHIPTLNAITTFVFLETRFAILSMTVEITRTNKTVVMHRACWFGEFSCNNGQCIQAALLCDGNRNCLDGSDENQCDIELDYVRCSDQSLIHRYFWCDEWPDCKDNHADELNCRNCSLDEFQCSNTRCIKFANVCDMVCDCAYTCEDENNCQGQYKIINTVLSWMPHNLTTVHALDIPICDSKSTYFCPKTTRCIHKTFICNSKNDCETNGESSDEFGCIYDNCSNNFIICDDGRCLPDFVQCDFIKHCTDGLDEKDCDFPSCTKKEFRCLNGQCIKEELKCDAAYDCYDRSDEIDCHSKKCPLGFYQCLTGQCIQSSWNCDFHVDCPDGSDEARCEHVLKKCIDTEFQCNNGQCIPKQLVCYETGNEHSGCADGSHLLNCRNWKCPEHLHKCLNSYCIHTSRVCNGQVDCWGSWNDEIGCPFQCSSEKQCECSDITINCTKIGLKNLPNDIEKEISKLDLSNNSIETIWPYTFKHLWRLRILYVEFIAKYLQDNKIDKIYNGSFFGLANVATLDLSINYIKIMGSNVFHGLTDLQYLYVQNMFNNINGSCPIIANLMTDEFRFCCLARLTPNCLPQADEFSSCEDLMSNIVLRICIWILGFIAFIGNILVIIWRLIYKINYRVHSFLITNLAIADMCMGIYLLIIAAVDAKYRGVYFIYDSLWRTSKLCQFAGFISTFSSELSVLTLTIITLHRFIGIAFPFHFQQLQMNHTRLVVIILWGIVIVLAGVPLLHMDYFKYFYGRSGVCLALHITSEKPSGWEYSVFIFLVLNLMSFTIISAAYIWMFLIAKNSQKSFRTQEAKWDKTMAKRMSLIVFTDFCCWMPIIILGFMSLSKVTIPPQVFAWIAVFILPLNAAINPVLYTLSTPSFVKPATKSAWSTRPNISNIETSKTNILASPCDDFNLSSKQHVGDAEIVPLKILHTHSYEKGSSLKHFIPNVTKDNSNPLYD
uniref:G-protein coupled receptors family 1 profile domain-containing protein n=1 Tax=Strigamia maritima TaxID=126957 RepID=T1JLT2_STRMM